MTVITILGACSSQDGTNINESYSRLGASVSDKVSVYVADDNLLHMYEPEGRDDIVLCNKAECIHKPYDERSNADPVCDAALNDKLNGFCLPVISGDHIYLFGKENLSEGVVYRENLDGSVRVRLYSINYQINIYSTVYVKDGYAYAEASIPIVENDDKIGGSFSNKSQTIIVKIELESGDVKEISPLSKIDDDISSMYILDVNDTGVYMGYRYGFEKESCKVLFYDIKADKTEELFDEKELEDMEVIGVTDKALCVADSNTKEAFEISLADRTKTGIYKPENNQVIYHIFRNRWIIGDMNKETSSYIEGDMSIVINDVVAVSCALGNYIDIGKSDNARQVIYGESIYSDKWDVVFEKNEQIIEEEKTNGTEGTGQLVWLTRGVWVDNCMDEKRMTAVNARIHELGCDFDVEFMGLDDDSYDSYQQGIDNAKHDGVGDLMWTGLGDGSDDSKEGTYYRNINQGNLLPLDDWLESDMGKELKEQYLPYEWELLRYDDHVYGVRNVEEQGLTYRLVINDDLASDFGLPDNVSADGRISIKELCDYLELIDSRSDIGGDRLLYLDWKWSEDDDEGYTQLGYIKLFDGIYMTSDEKVVNIWENDDMCRLWTLLSKMKKSSKMRYDINEELGAFHEGKYPVAIADCTGIDMDDKWMYMEDGTKLPVHSYIIAAPYLNKMENDVHGVTSWSTHKEEAKQLLTLVNTDKELANLLYYGVEGTDYELENDLAKGQYSADTECPANPRITHYQLGEAYDAGDKQEYCRKINELYDISPASGFVPDCKKAGADNELLEDVESFYKEILESEDASKTIIDFRNKLKINGYNKVLKKIQRQYDSWKKNK